VTPHRDSSLPAVRGSGAFETSLTYDLRLGIILSPTGTVQQRAARHFPGQECFDPGAAPGI